MLFFQFLENKIIIISIMSIPIRVEKKSQCVNAIFKYFSFMFIDQYIFVVCRVSEKLKQWRVIDYLILRIMVVGSDSNNSIHLRNNVYALLLDDIFTMAYFS